MKNIDDLLKESFDRFQPDVPPDAWSAISGGIKATGSGGEAAGAAKGLSIVTKIILAAAVPVVAGGIWFATRTETPVTSDPAMAAATEKVTAPAQPAPVTTGDKRAQEPAVPLVDPLVPAQHKPVSQPEPQKFKPVTQAPKSAGAVPPVNNPEHEPVVSEVNPIQHDAPARQVTTPPAKDSRTTTPPKRKLQDLYKRGLPEEKPVAIPEEEKLVVPNAFSPNHDGRNDRFIIPIENEVAFEIKIMNPGSEIVFESRDKNSTWDGTHMQNGEPCEAGTYSYVIRYQLKDDTEPRYHMGKVQIFR
jgi:gliding motility-associated-like protein